MHISSLTLHLESRNLVNEEALAHGEGGEGGGGAVAPKTRQTLQLIVSVLIVDNIRLNLSRLLTKTTVVYGKNHTNNMNTSVEKNTEVPKKKGGGGLPSDATHISKNHVGRTFPGSFPTSTYLGKIISSTEWAVYRSAITGSIYSCNPNMNPLSRHSVVCSATKGLLRRFSHRTEARNPAKRAPYCTVL